MEEQGGSYIRRIFHPRCTQLKIRATLEAAVSTGAVQERAAAECWHVLKQLWHCFLVVAGIVVVVLFTDELNLL